MVCVGSRPSGPSNAAAGRFPSAPAAPAAGAEESGRVAPDDGSEERLAAGFVAGDESCLEAVHHRCASLVHALARRALGDGWEAEDVTQQVFIAAWRGRHGYRPGRGGLTGWLVGITRHKIADALAARTRRSELFAAACAEYTASLTARSPDGPEDALDRLLLQGELARLPAAQQRVLRLAFYGALTQTQIAERTGLPLGTVKSHTRRGLCSLRRSVPVELAPS
ncbi:sigma-70 family RNA polymerase sigma factor [Streptomyces sp. NPDC002004]